MANTWAIAVVIVCVSVAAVGADTPATRPAAAPDLSTPTGAVITYFGAVDRNDVAAAKAATVHDAKIDKMIDGVIAEKAAQQHYRDAAVKRFGDDKRLARLGKTASWLIDLVKRGPVHENGDSAEIGEHGDFPCRKVDGQWRFDLVRQNPSETALDATIQYLNDSAAAYDKCTSQLSAGKWKSFDETEEARRAVAPKPPAPPESK